jgi:rhamnosyltransferase
MALGIIRSMSVDSRALCETRIIIPVRNGGERWREAAAALRGAIPDTSLVAVVDSSSTDGSDAVAADLGFELERIDPRTFNHGRTRQAAVDRFCQGREFALFLTHDAVIQGTESLTVLLDAFSNPLVGAAYGRQLPHHNSGPFGKHSASFLYPPTSDLRTLASAPRLGIRTAYISNSFAAYRIRALNECGGFPSRLILGEDTHVALRMLLAGWAVSYNATAVVRHSHDYSVLEEMRRYFDYGVLHAQLPELLCELGKPEGDGLRFVKSELRYMAAEAPWLLPEVLIRNAAKYIGYRLGREFRRLPVSLCRRLSMTTLYWDSPFAGDKA